MKIPLDDRRNRNGSDEAVCPGIIGVIDRRELFFQLGAVLVEKRAQFIKTGKLIPELCVDNAEQDHRVIGEQACHENLHTAGK